MRKKIPFAHRIRKGLTKPIGAFDIETTPFDKGDIQYLDAFLKFEDETVHHRARTPEELVDLLLSRENVIIYAHNGASFDFNFLLPIFFARKVEMNFVVQGSDNVIAIMLPNGIEIRDSLALIPMSLAAATKAFGTIEKGDIGLKKGEIYDPLNEAHQKYCMNDCNCTIAIVRAVIDLVAQHFGCGIGMSTASTALGCFQAAIPKDKRYWRLPKGAEEFCRNAYYGGFVYPGLDMLPKGPTISVDRNASFAECMREDAFPVCNPMFTMQYEGDKKAIYWVRVTAHENRITMPCIPYRDKHGTKWPVGRFTTYITNEEYDFALEQGYELEVLRGYYWEKTEDVFSEFINKLEKMEFGQPELKPLIKLIRNALYGKFGSQFFNREFHWGEPENLEDWKPLCSSKSGEVNPFIWYRDVPAQSPHIMPHWAAFVTARARLWMFKTMLTVGLDSVWYGDTDSVKGDANRIKECINSGMIDTSMRYGSAKKDEEYLWFHAMGPKVYHGVLIDGNNKMRAKGIPMRLLTQEMYEKTFENIMNEENKKKRNELHPKVEFHSTNRIMTRMKDSSKNFDRNVKRRMTDFRNSKSWRVSQEGIVRPPLIEEE